MYTLEQAVELARALEKEFHPDYHIALGGSCLHKGESQKDVDLYIYPASETMLSHADAKKVFSILAKLGASIVGVYLRVDWVENYPNKPFIQFTLNGIAVDLFFISWVSLDVSERMTDDELDANVPF